MDSFEDILKLTDYRAKWIKKDAQSIKPNTFLSVKITLSVAITTYSSIGTSDAQV